MEKKYLIKFSDTQIRGPFSETQVDDMIYEFILRGNELVCEIPGGEWQEIGKFTHFYDVFLGAMEKERDLSRDDRETFIDFPTQTNINSRTDDVDATVIYKKEQDPAPDEAEEDKTELYNEGDLRDIVKSVDAKKISEPLDTDQKSPIIPRAAIRSFGRGRGDGGDRKKRINPLVIIIAVIVLSVLYFKFSGPGTPEKKAFTFRLEGLSIEKDPVRIKLPVVESDEYSPVQSKKNLDQALALFRNDDFPSYRKAVDLLHKAMELDVSNKTILSYIAYGYFRLYEVSEKDTEYVNALGAIVTRAAQGDYNIQSLALAKIGYSLVKNDADTAIALVNEAMGTVQPPYNPDLLITGADALMRNGVYSDAFRLVSAVNEQNNNRYPRAFYLDGLIKINNGDAESALESFNFALEINPGHTLSKVKILEIGRDSGKIAEALAKHGREMSFRDVSDLLFILGNRELSLHEAGKAKDLFRNALNFSSENNELLMAYERLGGKTEQFRKKAVADSALSSEASAFLMRGDELFYNQQYRDASLQYRMAASLSPGSALVWAKLGEAYRKTYELDNAVKAFTEGLKLDKLSVDLLVKLGRVQTDLFNFVEADNNLKQALELDPDNPDTLFALGVFNNKRGAEEKAVEYFHKAVSNDFSHVDSLFELGKKSYEYESYEDARLIFQKVVAAQPTHFESYMYLTRITAKLDHISKAELYEETLSGMFPNSAEIPTGLALAYIDKMDFESAEKTLRKALAINRYSVPTLLAYQDLCINLGRQKDALAYLETIAIIAPYYLDAVQLKAKIYCDLGQYESCEKELVRLVSLTPYYPRAFLKLGELYFRAKKYQDAEEALLLEIEHNPAIRDSYVLLGDVYILENKTDKAMELFRNMLNERPKDPYGLLGFAKACFAQNDLACTENFVTQARHVDPAIADIYFLECQMYFKMNRFPEAANSCTEFLNMQPNHFYAPAARDTLSTLEKMQQQQ
ncbi:MAG: tetratricopeptide repeat protein [Oligoflexia bacterium]|nr:tetratricopeptide repeat protein [Oligoflexia bacterium]